MDDFITALEAIVQQDKVTAAEELVEKVEIAISMNLPAESWTVGDDCIYLYGYKVYESMDMFEMVPGVKIRGYEVKPTRTFLGGMKMNYSPCILVVSTENVLHTLKHLEPTNG